MSSAFWRKRQLWANRACVAACGRITTSSKRASRHLSPCNSIAFCAIADRPRSGRAFVAPPVQLIRAANPFILNPLFRSAQLYSNKRQIIKMSLTFDRGALRCSLQRSNCETRAQGTPDLEGGNFSPLCRRPVAYASAIAHLLWPFVVSALQFRCGLGRGGAAHRALSS